MENQKEESGSNKDNLYTKFNLDIPKMGDTICVRSDGGFFSLGIELKQEKSGFNKEDSKFTHVEICGGGHRSVRIAPPSAKPINIVSFYAGKFIRIRRYISDDWDRKRKHIAWTNATLCNTEYDRRGIIKFLFRWIKQHASKWFCSEGWLYSLQTEYPNALDGMKPEDCMPAHAASSPELATIWEGFIPKVI